MTRKGTQLISLRTVADPVLLYGTETRVALTREQYQIRFEKSFLGR